MMSFFRHTTGHQSYFLPEIVFEGYIEPIRSLFILTVLCPLLLHGPVATY